MTWKSAHLSDGCEMDESERGVFPSFISTTNFPFLPYFVSSLHCQKNMSETFASLADFDQSCLMLCDPTDCSPPGSSIHGIL